MYLSQFGLGVLEPTHSQLLSHQAAQRQRAMWQVAFQADQYRFGTIGGKYIGDSRVAAAYHQGGNTSPYGNWHRFNRGRGRG